MQLLCMTQHKHTNTAGGECYDRMRPLAYPDAHLLLVCYSIGNHESFENISDKWLPDLHHSCPNSPIVLLGLKSDLRIRGSEDVDGYLHSHVSSKEGRKLARNIGEVEKDRVNVMCIN